MTPAGALNPIHAEPLTRCPRCDTSLAELPARSECPNCTLPYDEETTIWRPKLSGMGCVAFATLAAAIPIWIALAVTNREPLFWLMTAGFGAGALSYIWRLFAMRTWRLSVGPAGILVRQANSRLLPWEQVLSVDRWPSAKTVRVEVGGGTQSVPVHDFLPNRMSADAFREAVRRRQPGTT